jgi:hypothetical protein
MLPHGNEHPLEIWKILWFDMPTEGSWKPASRREEISSPLGRMLVY